ncbi:MAG: preprotein translocase subunit SecG [Clostridia bacterium]|nr:preprotein translocase subunit SecG [Clostridia bacterium]
MQLAVTILHIVIAVALVVIVLMQTGKDPGLSGVISGSGAQESFFGKNRSKSKEAVLGRITTALAILFILTSLALSIFFRG